MEALHRHASLMHHTPANPFSQPEEPITMLSASLVEKLQICAPDQAIEPIFMSLLAKIYQEKPKEMDVMQWVPPVVGSPRFMDALKDKVCVNASTVQSLWEKRYQENSPIYQTDAQFTSLYDKECEIIGSIFYVSALLDNCPQLSSVLMEKLKKDPSDEENFRTFLLEILWLSKNPEGAIYACEHHTKLQKAVHPLTKQEKTDVKAIPLYIFAHALWYDTTCKPQLVQLKGTMLHHSASLVKSLQTACQEADDSQIESLFANCLLSEYINAIVDEPLSSRKPSDF